MGKVRLVSVVFGYFILGIGSFVELKLATYLIAIVIIFSGELYAIREILIDTQYKQVQRLTALLVLLTGGQHEIPERKDHQ